mmetsp:Transcript_39668/g.88780  ORF Transcript_39668/g.88780 Transcript_39668/m.88780 type:complete len:213 (-) Transcript_39668:1423-2061(-)
MCSLNPSPTLTRPFRIASPSGARKPPSGQGLLRATRAASGRREPSHALTPRWPNTAIRFSSASTASTVPFASTSGAASTVVHPQAVAAAVAAPANSLASPPAYGPWTRWRSTSSPAAAPSRRPRRPRNCRPPGESPCATPSQRGGSRPDGTGPWSPTGSTRTTDHSSAQSPQSPLNRTTGWGAPWTGWPWMSTRRSARLPSWPRSKPRRSRA